MSACAHWLPDQFLDPWTVRSKALGTNPNIKTSSNPKSYAKLGLTSHASMGQPQTRPKTPSQSLSASPTHAKHNHRRARSPSRVPAPRPSLRPVGEARVLTAVWKRGAPAVLLRPEGAGFAREPSGPRIPGCGQRRSADGARWPASAQPERHALHCVGPGRPLPAPAAFRARSASGSRPPSPRPGICKGPAPPSVPPGRLLPENLGKERRRLPHSVLLCLKYP